MRRPPIHSVDWAGQVSLPPSIKHEYLRVTIDPAPPEVYAHAEESEVRAYRPEYFEDSESGSSTDIESLDNTSDQQSSVFTNVRMPEELMLRSRWSGTFSNVKATLGVWYKKNFPTTLKQNRKGFQYMVIYLFCTPVLFIQPVVHILQGVAAFPGTVGVQMVDNTVGGSLTRATDSVVCTIIAFAICLTIFLPFWLLGFQSLEANGWLRWLFYSNAILIAYFWNWIRYHWPGRRLMFATGFACSIFFYTVIYDNWLRAFWQVTVARILGTFVGALVTTVLLRSTARDALKNDLGNACQKLAALFQPLVSLEMGVIESNSIFANFEDRRVSAFLRSPRNSRFFRKNLLGGANNSSLVDKSSKHRRDHATLSYEAFLKVKQKLWSEVEQIYRLLTAQKPLITAAKREVAWSKPHVFPAKQYVAFLDSVTCLFFHVTALYLVLETQDAVVQTNTNDSFMTAVGEHWAWTNTLKIGKKFVHIPIPKSKVTNGLPSRIQSEPIGGLGNKLVFPSNGFKPPEKKPPKVALCRTLTPERLLREYADTFTKVPDSAGTTTTVEPRRSTLHRMKTIDDLNALEMVHMIRSQGLEGEVTSSQSETPEEKERWFDLANGPIERWSERFGPIIGKVSRHVSDSLVAISNTLKHKIDFGFFQSYAMAESCLADVILIRDQTRSVIQMLFDDSLVTQSEGGVCSGTVGERLRKASKLATMKERVGSAVLEDIMGLDIETYTKLPLGARGLLWSSYGAVQDKTTRTVAALLAIQVELRHTINRVCNLAIKLHIADPEAIVEAARIAEVDFMPPQD